MNAESIISTLFNLFTAGKKALENDINAAYNIFEAMFLILRKLSPQKLFNNLYYVKYRLFLTLNNKFLVDKSLIIV